jgi:hypothetical protein
MTPRGRKRNITPSKPPDPVPSDRTLGELGVVFGLASIGGVGIPMIWPDNRTLGIVIMLIGFGGAAIAATLAAIRIFRARAAERKLPWRWITVASAVVACGSLLFFYLTAEINLSEGAVVELFPEPVFELRDGAYTVPVRLKNAGDLPILDTNYLLSTWYSPTVLTEDQEKKIFFDTQAKQAEDDWKAHPPSSMITNAMRKDTVRLIYGPGAPLTPSQKEDVNKGREQVYVFITIRYRDSKMHSI